MPCTDRTVRHGLDPVKSANLRSAKRASRTLLFL